MLGKRKRRPAAPRSDSSADSTNNDAHSVFKAHFEASFAPLPLAATNPEAALSEEDELFSPDDDEDEDEDETDWEGISEPEHQPRIEVIEHTTPTLSRLSKHALKAFMSPNPPVL